MPAHIAHNARFLQFHYSTTQAARYLKSLGIPLEHAIAILAKG